MGSKTTKVGAAADLPSRAVTGAGRWAVGHGEVYFAASRRCRHLGADLAEGSIDTDGCLVCPWHGAKYNVKTGRMVRGPQGVFALIPGLGRAFKALTIVVPLQIGKVRDRQGTLYVEAD